ncbi:MAG: hypothetical protein OXI15_02255 [Chromatiales bacterium]|nr:hypothetical protein [Chromatiales bacterium]
MSDNPAYTHLWTPPAPPHAVRPLIARLWDSRHAEDWIVNGTHPHDRSAPGDYLTATGADQNGRWARLEDETLRITNRDWLRHITEVSAIGSIWWRTVWQRWPKRPDTGNPGADVRIALNAGDMPMPMFHLYARLDVDDNLPATSPTLMTFGPDVDPGMPTDATAEVPVNGDVDELLEWLLWLPFDGRRKLNP